MIKIISGGQTGADMGGLEAAREYGFPTGGYAPKGWMTERYVKRSFYVHLGWWSRTVGTSSAQTRMSLWRISPSFSEM